MVTWVPTWPEVEDRLVIFGAGTTVNGSALLCVPLTVTITLPVVAALGIVATMLVVDHVGAVVTGVPLKVIVLLP